jgi:2-methylcitrate dehydratase PrpD
MDCLGAMIAGQTLPEIKGLAHEIDGELGQLGGLLVSSSAGVSLELDEGCAAARGHPGIHVVPVALHAASRRDASGETFLRAVVAGYEIAARLGAATRFRSRIHPHGTWGGCGAAVAAGLIEGADAVRLASAMRIAASLAVATNYEAVNDGATVRNMWTGIGNLTAYLALRAATGGFEGPLDAPARVFGETLGDSFDHAVADGELGTRWYMLGNYFKLYACCRHAHAAVDAFRAIVSQCSPTRDQIESVEVHTYARAAEAVGRTLDPRTPLGAKFSLPYIFSVYLETGDLGQAAFEPPLLDAPRHRELGTRMVVVEDPSYTARLPDERVARVALQLVDGRRFEVESVGSHGDPHDPLSIEELEAKFLRLSGPVLGTVQTRSLINMIAKLETTKCGALADAARPNYKTTMEATA